MPDAIDFDVAVVGAGPAGSTVASLLADRGLRVVMFEKDRHPRFHIGESLLPLNLPLLERLGVAEQVAAIGMLKPAAEFHAAEYQHSVAFRFDEAFAPCQGYAYQVRRSEFDAILAERARAGGVQLIEQCRVAAVDFGADRVVLDARHGDGREQRCSARYLVDASGRDTFVAAKLGVKRRNPQHASAALYGHFRGAQRGSGECEGNIRVFWFAHGWFWFIPLRDGVTSVGAVCWPSYLKTRRGDPSAFLLQTIALCPPLAERLAQATLVGAVTATGNYSYRSEQIGGERWIMVGDAYAFVDPVFSSGVYLAMSGAFRAAEVVAGALRDGARAPALRRDYQRFVQRGLSAFCWMIYRMTAPAMRELMMNPRNAGGMRRAVVSTLAGDVYRRGPVWWRMLAFRALYYANVARIGRRSLAAWRQRRGAIRGQTIHATDGSG